MIKSIYDKALESYSHINATVQNEKYKLSFEDQVEHLANITRALQQAQKQEKLLEHYKDLAEVRKLLYKLTTNFKQLNKDRITILLTQEKLISDIIEELEKQISEIENEN